MSFFKNASFIIKESFANPTSSSTMVSIGKKEVIIREGGNYQDADLTGADLSGANLASVNLTNAKLHGANLTNTNLSKADLTNVDLSNAVISGTTFNGATMNQANLKDVEYIKPPSGIEVPKDKK